MDETALTRIKIVLVRPLGGLNVGSVARVMKNMGLTQLVLVEPQCDCLGEEARKMALHALDVLEGARIVESIPEALIGCQRSIATSARSRHLSVIPENPRKALPWLFGADSSALIFGPEDKGLSNEDLKYAQRFVQIPSSPAYPSLNLAQAVAVCCYELYQNCLENQEVVELEKKAESDTAASLDALERYYQKLETLLLKIGYLYPHTAESRMVKFRLLFNRAQPSANEVAMLQGIISQMEWALGRGDGEMGGWEKFNSKLALVPLSPVPSSLILV
ncbi:RNA methyltransferase [Floridanema evergladense]|uniref:tRNA (cytidine/uridine-2'-O-)-methyltransferase TrmJ n=1 Tax=Floridaenema evergladense BLCC-F167 TaxID=3153639 RepID=A0ABV4WID9_9CYAN